VNAKSAKGADTRLRIIEAAAELFHKQGVGATSPDQIIEASGTGKGQFYHYFKSKEGLVHEVLQSHLDAIRTGAAPLKYEIESWQDLEQWFLAQVALQRRFGMTRGCPFGTIGNEVTENDELIRQDLSLIFEVVKNKLAAFFIKEKAIGRLSKDADEDQMADFCIATIQGAMLMGKIKRDSQPVEAAVREALAHLKRHMRTTDI
jgi:AcrR family transcriptional regulator